MESLTVLQINRVRAAGFFSKIAIIAIFISFYLYLWSEAIFGIYKVRISFLAFGYTMFAISIFLKWAIHVRKDIVFYYLAGLGLYLISFPFWQNSSDFNVYLSPVTALVVLHDYKFFKKFIPYFLVFTLLLAAYEFLSKEYIFIVSRKTLFGYQALDEKLFGGLSGIFRAKVFFEGPLALSQFAIGAALLFRNKINLLFLIFLIAIFANGRLGIIICSAIIFLYYIKKYNLLTIILKPKNLIFLFFGILLLLLAIFNFLEESSIERLKESFNTSNEGNLARMNFWLNGIKTYASYDWLHLLVGNSGYFESIFLNNAENGWITLLLNNGILGFLFYLLPVFICFLYGLKKLNMFLAYVLILVFCMVVQTFHLGASANLFYWLIIYSFLDQKQWGGIW